jgi:hypothetical protein
MSNLAGKRLTKHEKNEKKKSVSLFAGFWLMTVWNTVNEKPIWADQSENSAKTI